MRAVGFFFKKKREKEITKEISFETPPRHFRPPHKQRTLKTESIWRTKQRISLTAGTPEEWMGGEAARAYRRGDPEGTLLPSFAAFRPSSAQRGGKRGQDGAQE
jgi:hypothetical protein